MSTENTNEVFSSDSFSATYFTSFDQMDTQNQATDVQGTYFCDACQIDCENFQKYQTHCQGALHSSKTVKNSEDTPLNNDQVATKKETKDKPDLSNFECKLCNVRTTGAISFEAHIAGKAHQKKTQAQGQGAVPSSKPVHPSTDTVKDGQTAVKKEPNVDKPAPSNFECKLCNVHTTGSITFEAHLAGKAHQRKLKLAGLSESGDTNVWAQAQAQSSKVILTDDVKGKVHLQPALDLLTTPTLGLQYIIEIHNKDPRVKTRYQCELCDSKCDPHTVTSHIVGTKHRLAYIKKHYPEHMERIYPGGDKAIKKSESSPIIQKCSEEIEAKEGRKKVRVQTEFTPGATGAKVPVKRRADQQGGPEAKKSAGLGSSGRGRGAGRQESAGKTPGGRGRGGTSNRGGGGWKNEQPRGRGRGGFFTGTGRGRGRGSSGDYYTNREPLVGYGSGQWSQQSSFGMYEKMNTYGPPPKHGLRSVLVGLADFEISTESEASLALEVSNALTQSLLNYRLKTVSTGPPALANTLSKRLSDMSEQTSRGTTNYSDQDQDYSQGYSSNTEPVSSNTMDYDYYDTPTSGGNNMYKDDGGDYYGQSSYSTYNDMY